jgi:hypothetical protein
MSCVGNSIPSFDAFMAAVERCGVEYGGANWQGLAMTGAATVLAFAFIIAFGYWIITEIRS